MKGSVRFDEIKPGRKYRLHDWGSLGGEIGARIRDDFLYDEDVCAECVFKNDLVARFRFGGITDAELGVSRFTLGGCSEMSESEYSEAIAKYNARIKCTENSARPMPTAE